MLYDIAQQKRVTRNQVNTLIADTHSWEENADTWKEPFDALADLEVPDDVNTDGLDDIHVDDQSFEDVAETLTQVSGVKQAATTIRDTLAEIEGLCFDFREHAEVWVDEDADREDRAEAKEQLQGAAESLNEKLSELDSYNIDLGTAR
ncbi:hypothetical protein AWN90_42035 [Nocardia terpenica]|uniref:Uncharacterized protein n=1 Tax=Nocardia terpenica TaxID=455432 RepID=A0A164K6T3_9NOCA|nr:hypothetical protein AWN90_42035 [Nocardia terpenica]